MIPDMACYLCREGSSPPSLEKTQRGNLLMFYFSHILTASAYLVAVTGDRVWPARAARRRGLRRGRRRGTRHAVCVLLDLLIITHNII